MSRYAFFEIRIAVVQVCDPLDQLRMDVVADDAQAPGEALLNAHVETFEVGASTIVVGLDHARAAASSAHRKLRKAGKQLRHRG